MVSGAEFWGSLFWLAIGMTVSALAYDLEIGTLNQPGSGFALFFVGLAMVALSLMLGVRSLSTPGPSVRALWQNVRGWKVLQVVALLVAYGLLFETVGFFLCTVALLLALMIWVDPVDWRVALMVGIGATWIVDYALTHWLKISIPDGILTGWI